MRSHSVTWNYSLEPRAKALIASLKPAVAWLSDLNC